MFCVDGKRQIQALDRTQPGLPIKTGRYGPATHDDTRNGTTRLFAALNLLDGKVIGQAHSRQRHQGGERPEAVGSSVLAGIVPAPDHGQLRHTQGASRPDMAGETPAVCLSFRSDQFQLATYGGARVPRNNRQGESPRGVCQRSGVDRGNRSLHRFLESASKALCLDRHGQRHFGQD